MKRLDHEIALLEMRSEQLHIHLRSLPKASAEARKVRSDLLMMRMKIGAHKKFTSQAAVVEPQDGRSLH